MKRLPVAAVTAEKCAQCKRPLLTEWYRRHLKTGDGIHVTCFHYLHPTDLGRASALKSYSEVQWHKRPGEW